MRQLFTILFLLVLAADAWAWKPLFVGHRGCNIGVENTAEAYRNGVDVYGYDGLECDVRVTKDGFYVISHDETTNRLGGNLTVADATLAELRAEQYTQTRGGVTYTGHICTVAEYLAICVEKGVFPVIELKWTTGINNNDMSNFDGLAHLVIDQGLTDKVIFLTSMKKSQEYIAEHYPQFTRQWLCNANWEGNEEWCKQYGLNPSISIGNFDGNTVKKFHDMGLHVAMWTVDTKDNYLKYGKMGVSMMTCNSLKPYEMPELEDIDWESDGLEQPMADGITVDATDCYTMTGMSMDRSQASGGIYISVTHLSDGSVQTRKILGQ
ncbi:MAG: hypothetical protein IKW85_10090 [Muribaculaceae bacterium]|nr:hypothetical protein [Muribaculaceae bacterium]